MAGYTPPPLTPPGPPNDTNPDSGLLGRGGAGGNLPPEIVDNQPLLQQAIQDSEITLVQAQNPYITPIEGILGGKAVAEKNQEYFAVVFEAGDTSPEIIDQTQFKVTYLCDSVLNVSKPAEDTVATNNIIQNFERQKIATVRVDQGTSLNQQLGGNHKITAVGSLEPVLGTQLGKGPYQYSTTMSFIHQDQIDGVPGVPITNYYIVSQKQGGYQDLPFANKTSGNITVEVSGTPIGGWSYGNNWIEANETTPTRLHYDGLNSVETGSGSFMERSFSDSPNPSSTAVNNLGFNSDNYYNRITILTGSLEGKTRIKTTLGASVTIVTSSIRDLFMSIESEPQNINPVITLKVFKSDGVTVQELGSSTSGMIATNPSLMGTNGGPGQPGSTLYNINKLKTGDLNSIQPLNQENFSWGPIVGTNNDATNLYSSIDITVNTDFFDVNEDDFIYGELYVSQDLSSSFNLYIDQDEQPTFPPSPNQGSPESVNIAPEYAECLSQWKNDATLRKYKYRWGSLKITQEVPAGIDFIQGQTGVTASYGYIGDNGFVTASYYDYTSSYWVGYNNIENESSSFSYITASSALSNFYGGEYTQVNPGIESYNLYNADGAAITPLFPNNNPANKKQTWDEFGFNPIRLPFIPLVGDFIRFEYSKYKVFQIIGINSLGGTLKLKLDGIIPISTVLDNFVIYRIVEDGQYIILDIKKNTEAGVDQAFSGIITAQYRSENLEARSDQLIFDLKQAGIIEEGAYLSRRGYI